MLSVPGQVTLPLGASFLNSEMVGVVSPESAEHQPGPPSPPRDSARGNTPSTHLSVQDLVSKVRGKHQHDKVEDHPPQKQPSPASLLHCPDQVQQEGLPNYSLKAEAQNRGTTDLQMNGPRVDVAMVDVAMVME